MFVSLCVVEREVVNGAVPSQWRTDRLVSTCQSQAAKSVSHHGLVLPVSLLQLVLLCSDSVSVFQNRASVLQCSKYSQVR